MRLNAPKGLGDAICLRAVALHLVERGEPVQLFTPWPDVFAGLPVIACPPSEIDDDTDLRHVAACSCRIERVQALDMFTNAKQRAGVPDAEFRIDWRIQNKALVLDLKRRAEGRPILVFQPVKRANTPAQAMVRPNADAFGQLIAKQRECFRVKVGHPSFVDDDAHVPCEFDLFGKTSVSDVLDVVSAADRVFSEPCFLALAAQAMNKHLVCMFSTRALASDNPRVGNMRPQRIFHKPRLCMAVWDDQRGPYG